MSPQGETKIPAKRQLVTKPSRTADKVFFGLTSVAANFSIVLILLILGFLLYQAWPAFQSQGFSFFSGETWDSSATPQIFQIGPMLWGSVLVALLGMVIALPLAISLAYFIEFMAAKKIAAVATTLVDLLAAIPSIVIGLWGFAVFGPVAQHWASLLHDYLGWIPYVFYHEGANYGGSPFIAGLVVSVMIVPIITSVTREIFSQMDRDVVNASIALGAGRAATFRKVILPTASGGIVGGALLGLGRALGETIAIFFVLNLVFHINFFQVINGEGGTVASMIVSKFGEADASERSALMASGIVLFVLTLLISALSSYIVKKAQPWRTN